MWLPRICRPRIVALVVLALAACSAARADAAQRPNCPVLLVHGITWDLDQEDATWGRYQPGASRESDWTGMVGFLQSRGLAYGGAIRPIGADVALPQRLDKSGVTADPRTAQVFVLRFSKAANTDGIAYKALELAESIKELCRFTGADKVRLVAHSAGGIVARAYLQDALPGVRYRGDVERLITVGTPHLGSSVAEHWGDFLGTRATSIKPGAALVRNLNSKLDLPDDVTFASIVVRGIATDARGKGSEFDHLINQVLLAALPVEYQSGGDQVVHVRSQNLRLAQCATRYEERTGRPVQYVLARVADPARGGWPLDELTDRGVHVVAPYDPMVHQLAYGLLNRKAVLWKSTSPEKLAGWYDWQARLHTNGIVESQAMGKHPMSWVTHVRIEDFRLVDNHGLSREYRFHGKAWSANVAIPLRKRWTHVHGTVAMTFDPYGRVLAARADVQKRKDG